MSKGRRSRRQILLQKVFGYTGASFGVGKSLAADILASLALEDG